MADEATRDPPTEAAAETAPDAPKRDPGAIEGEATEIGESGDQSSPQRGEAEFAAGAPASDPAPGLAELPPAGRVSASSFTIGLAGAVVGAAAALATAWYLDPRAAPLDELAARQGALEASASAQTGADKALAARLTALESTQAGFAKASALGALDDRVGKLASASVQPDALVAIEMQARAAREEAAKALAAAAGAKNGAATADPRAAELQIDVAALGDRIAKLEAAIAAGGEKAGAPAATSPTPTLDPRIGEMQASEAALKDRIAKLEAGLAAVAEKVGAPAPTPAPDPRIGEMQAGEAALGDRIAKLEAALAAPKVETRVAPTETPPKADPAAQAVAALALERRLGAGEPFVAEWSALSRLSADSAALAALKPYADSGAPTVEGLAASFAKIAPGLVAAAIPEKPGGAFGTLRDELRGLVRVRAVGEVAGEDPAALVSQIQSVLARGDLSAALGIYARLSEAARKASADWVKTAEARAAADPAARALAEAAIAKLGAARN